MVTVATGVNNRGQIVGVSPFSAAGYDELEIAFLFENGKSVPLPTLNPQLPGSPEYTGAQAINASGLIVGWDSGKAVMWEQGNGQTSEIAARQLRNARAGGTESRRVSM